MIHIDLSLLFVKAHYFFLFAVMASIVPFLTPMLLQQGATPKLIGMIYSTQPFCILIAKPSFGVLADKLQKRKLIFMACEVVMVLAFFLIYFTPDPAQSSSTNQYQTNSTNSTNSTIPTISTGGASFTITSQITHIWILQVIGFAFMASCVSLGDTIVISMLPHIDLYGRQRLFGSVGYGLFSIIAGLLSDVVSQKGKLVDYSPCFWLVLVCGIITFAIDSQFVVMPTHSPENLFRHIIRLLVQAETLLFIMAILSIGFFTGILWTFLMVYVNELGGTQLLIGLITGVQCFLGEIPFMLVSDWLLRKIGHGYAMTLVLAFFALRYFLYSLVTNPWMLLPIEITQGVCYGSFFTALATYSSYIAPASTQSTLQGLLQAIFEGLGIGIGSFFGGLVYDAVGGKVMWLIMSISLAITAVIHGALLFIIQRSKKRRSQLEDLQIPLG